MTLKRTGAYWKAGLLTLAALALLIADIILATGLLTQSTGVIRYLLPTILPTATCLALPVTLFAFAAPIVMLRRERKLRAAVANGGIALQKAGVQPDRLIALCDGGLLTLSRQQIRIAAFRDAFLPIQFALGTLPVLGSLVFVVMLLGGGEADIHSLALVLLCIGLIGASSLWLVSNLRKRWLRIQANDQGVTVSRPFSAQQFIPWNDIVVFLRTTAPATDAPEGSYILWGKDHLVRFVIGSPSTAVEGKEKPSRVENSYRYEGGYDRYASDARRLLSTIVARGYVALQLLPDDSPAARAKQRKTRIPSLRLADVLAAPEAPPELQPSSDKAEMGQAAVGKIKLASHLATPAFLAQMMLWFIGMLALVIPLGLILHLPYFSIALLAAGNGFAIMLFALLIPMLLAYAFAFAWMRARQKAPAVTADENGLQMANGHATRIRWKDVRAWVVVPSTGSRPTTYLVFSSDQIICWIEPEGAELGGRHVAGGRPRAFHARAAELRSVIGAQTGLPLRMLHLTADDHTPATQR